MYKNLKKISKGLHLTCAYDKELQQIFPKVPIIGFKNCQNVRLHLLRGFLYVLERNLH